MADEIDVLREQVKVLTEQLAAMGGTSANFNAAMNSWQKEAEKREKAAKLSEAERKKQADKHIEQLKKLHDQHKRNLITDEELAEQASELERELGYLTKGLDKTTKANAAAAIQQIKNIEIVKGAYVDLAKGTKDLAIKLTSQAFSAYSGILKGIQSGANGIQQSASMMSADLDLSNTGIQGMAGMATTAGTAMMGMGGRARIAGGALMVLGQAASLASGAFTELEKFKIEFFAKEIEKSFEAFKSLSKNGVVLGDGLMGLRDAAHGTGLSMTTLSNISKANQADLSAAGMGATGGFKLMAKAFKDGGKTFKGSLLNLGYDLEEQGELVAKTMAQMRRSGVDPNKADIQSSTKEYAANLRLISAITGKDAKAKMEEAKKTATNAAARAKILRMQRGGDKEAGARFEAQMATAAAQGLGDAFLQKFVTSDAQGRGGVSTDTGFNVADAGTNGQLGNSVDEMVSATKDSTKTMEQFRTSMAERTGKTNELMGSEAFASSMEQISAAAILTSSSTATKVADFFIKTVTPAIEGIQGGAEGKAASAEIQGQLNSQSEKQRQLNNLIIQGEENRLALEVKAAEGIVKYTELMVKAHDQITKLIDKMDSPFSYLMSKVSDLAMGLVGLVPLLFMFKGGLGGLIGSMGGSRPELIGPPPRPGGPSGGAARGGLVRGAANLARGAGPTAAVLGAGYAGYKAGEYINDSFLTNDDGTGKIANWLGSIDGSDAKSAKEDQALKDAIAAKNARSTFDRPKAELSKSGTTKEIEVSSTVVAELQKLSALVEQQNKLAKEANDLRTQLVDLSESHKRIAGDIRSNTA